MALVFLLNLVCLYHFRVCFGCYFLGGERTQARIPPSADSPSYFWLPLPKKSLGTYCLPNLGNFVGFAYQGKDIMLFQKSSL